MPPPAPPRKLLLIGWDAADWKIISPLMDAGLMPTLSRFVEQGCMGNLATLQPCLSPMLWTSIATGKLADAHGVHGFVEPTPDGGNVRLVGSHSRKAKAIWDICGEAGLRTHVLGWYASHPAEAVNGVAVSDQFLHTAPANLLTDRSWVHPPELADRLSPLRVSPAELGPTDLLPFIPQLPRIDLSRDPRPGKLAEAISAAASIHAVATDVLANHPWNFAAVYYDALDRVGHEFMPYHPPRLPHIPAEDFETYRHVMTGIYRFHDMMLETLLGIAGEDATVMIVSDHGFHSDHLRPAQSAATSEASAALWHRELGILAMRGPGIRADERISGATLLDIVPTILMLLGLPIGRDMPGRPLAQALIEPAKVEYKTTWETPGSSPPPAAPPDPAATTAAVRQLIELGYLSSEALTGAQLAETARREGDFNLAVVYLSTGRAGRAIELLEPIAAAHPADVRYAMTLAAAYATAGRHREVCSLLESAEARGVQHADLDLMLARSLVALEEFDRAAERLTRAQGRAPANPALHTSAGDAWLSMNRLVEAESAFRRAIELDPDRAAAHQGLGKVQFKQQRFEPAAEAALRAVGLVHAFPEAHYLLGAALAAMGDEDRAILSFQAAIGIDPNFREAHERLAELLLNRGQVESAMRHRQIAQGR